MNESKFSYGGQAVIEGVMMRGRHSLAIAIRHTSGRINIERWDISKPGKRPGFFGWPFIRGTVNMVDALILGMKTIVHSANQMLDDGEEGESLSNTEIAITVVVSLALGIGLFFLFPAFLAQIIKRWAPGRGLQNILEGLTRIAIFLLYVFCISLIKDVQRVFEYHGAEHKVIYAYESGAPLSVEAARGMSRLHPRCGTSFLLLVMAVSILIYSLLPPLTMLQRLASRLILLPIIAGIAYELIRLAGKRLDNPVVYAISWPGMQLQRLTTREPDEGQIEVAIAALSRVLRDDGILPPEPVFEVTSDVALELAFEVTSEVTPEVVSEPETEMTLVPESEAASETWQASEPVSDVAPEPVPEPMPEPALDPALEPALDPALESALDPTSEPALDPVPEPALEPDEVAPDT